MPLVLDPPAAYCETDVSVVYALDRAPPASGSDGLEVFRQYQDACMHAQDRPSIATRVANDEESMRHVPFKKVGTMKVRFQQPTPMKPRTIDVELDEVQ